jgi:hypothetical protein
VPEHDVVCPANYKQPSIVWAVEYADERQPGSRFQAGAFTTEAEARKLLRQLDKTGTYGELSINLIAVHQFRTGSGIAEQPPRHSCRSWR